MSSPSAFSPAKRAGGGDAVSDILSAAVGALEAHGPRIKKTKRIILIRHGRSSWNEFLGAHKKAQWEEHEKSRTSIRGALKSLVRPGVREREGSTELLEVPADGGAVGRELSAGPDGMMSAANNKGGFWSGVRGGLKQVGNAISHAGKLNQVDHPLSPGGLCEARALRACMADLARRAAEVPEGSGEAAVLECRHWFISPFLRALQTAAYVLAPLRGRAPDLHMRVTPRASEIINSTMSQDCQGKKGNVGFRVVARALGKTAELLEDEEDDALRRTITGIRERQDEMLEVSATLCAMDLTEVSSVWWSDISNFKKENMRQEDMRIRRFVALILKHEADCLGVVAHSLLFQRLIQLFWPNDPLTQEELRVAMRNGAPSETKDPLRDKIVNCGTLVLTLSYYELDPAVTAAKRADVEIVAAQFLFGGRMESGVPGGGPVPDLPDGAAGEAFEEVSGALEDEVSSPDKASQLL